MRMKSWNRKSSTASPISREEAKITLVTVEDRPGISAAIFAPLAEAGVNVRHDRAEHLGARLRGSPRRGHRHDLLLPDQSGRPRQEGDGGRQAAGHIAYDDLIIDTDVAKVSVVGIGMRSHAGVAARMFKALADENINIKVISTCEIKISVLIDRKYMELAVQALHDAFELERV